MMCSVSGLRSLRRDTCRIVSRPRRTSARSAPRTTAAPARRGAPATRSGRPASRRARRRRSGRCRRPGRGIGHPRRPHRPHLAARDAEDALDLLAAHVVEDRRELDEDLGAPVAVGVGRPDHPRVDRRHPLPRRHRHRLRHSRARTARPPPATGRRAVTVQLREQQETVGRSVAIEVGARLRHAPDPDGSAGGAAPDTASRCRTSGTACPPRPASATRTRRATGSTRGRGPGPWPVDVQDARTTSEKKTRRGRFERPRARRLRLEARVRQRGPALAGRAPRAGARSPRTAGRAAGPRFSWNTRMTSSWLTAVDLALDADVVVRDQRDVRVAHLQLAGEQRLGELRHVDDLPALLRVEARLGPRREPRPLDHHHRPARVHRHALLLRGLQRRPRAARGSTGRRTRRASSPARRRTSPPGRSCGRRAGRSRRSRPASRPAAATRPPSGRARARPPAPSAPTGSRGTERCAAGTRASRRGAG